MHCLYECHCGHLDPHFVLWVMIEYHLVCFINLLNCSSCGHWKLFQLAPGSHCHMLVMVRSFFLFEHALTSWHYEKVP